MLSQSLYKNKFFFAFSLTELMIVVAIAAFISAVAIPNYKSYINKAKVTDMIATMDPCQVMIYQYFLQNGSFPDGSTSQPVMCYGQSIPVGSQSTPLKNNGITASYYVNSTSGYADLIVNHPDVKTRDDGNGAVASLHIRFSQTNQNASTGGGGDLIYQCGVTATNPVPSKYLPGTCNMNLP